MEILWTREEEGGGECGLNCGSSRGLMRTEMERKENDGTLTWSVSEQETGIYQLADEISGLRFEYPSFISEQRAGIMPACEGGRRDREVEKVYCRGRMCRIRQE